MCCFFQTKLVLFWNLSALHDKIFFMNDRESFGNIWILKIDVAFLRMNVLSLLISLETVTAFIHSERVLTSPYFRFANFL